MAYLIGQFWFWLLLALLLGLAVGWLTCSRDTGASWWRGLVPWGVILGVGGMISVLRVLPNGPGFWFDLGMLMLASYLIGCCLACLLKRMGMTEAEPAVLPMAAAPTAAKATVAAADASEAPEEAITGLSGPRGGKGDDLTKIYGIDAETQKKLNGLGIYHYDQLATMTPGQRRWLFRQLGHEGRFPSWWWRWRYDAEKLAAAPVAVAAAPKAASKPKAEAKPKTEAKPKAAAPVAAAAAPALEGNQPKGLAAPRGGKADDLKRIRGIGKQNEGRLHGLGIWHFDQVAAWSADEAKWIGGYLAFPGRIEREDWVGQAKVLATGGQTDFSKRVDKGEVATSKDDTNDDGQGNVAALGKDGSFGGKKPAGKPPGKAAPAKPKSPPKK